MFWIIIIIIQKHIHRRWMNEHIHLRAEVNLRISEYRWYLLLSIIQKLMISVRAGMHVHVII